MQKPFVPQSEIQQRLKKLTKLLPAKTALLLFSNPIQYRNADTEYPFYQDSNFWYFTGLNLPDCVWLFLKNSETESQTILFVKAKKSQHEIWFSGEIPTFDEIKTQTGATKIYPLTELLSTLSDKFKQFQTLYFDDQKISYPKLRSQITNLTKSLNLKLETTEILLQELRLFKSDWEIEQMKMAAKITASGFDFVQKRVNSFEKSEGNLKLYEYQLEADLSYFYQKQGANLAYPHIVASGKNATILHYQKNQDEIKHQDLILIDSGAEFNYYASDVTRTLVLGREMNSWQIEIYNLVLKAQIEVIDLASKFLTQTVTFVDLHQKSVQVLTEGLIELKIIKASFDEAIQKKLYLPFYMHSIGHSLGLDVHDLGNLKTRTLKPGMTFTIEPGLYLQNHSLNYKNIGVRIEDDVFLSKNGLEILTQEVIK